MPNLFHFVLLSVVGCCLVSLNLRFDCTLALLLSKKTVFRDFSRISSGEHQFLFSQANYFRCIISFTSCWPQRNAFLNETLFPLTLPIIRPATALRLSHLSSNYALLHFKQTWHSTNYNTTHCFNPKIVLPCHFSFLLIYAKKSQLQLLITMPPFIRQNRDDQVLFPIIQQLYSATN